MTSLLIVASFTVLQIGKFHAPKDVGQKKKASTVLYFCSDPLSLLLDQHWVIFCNENTLCLEKGP